MMFGNFSWLNMSSPLETARLSEGENLRLPSAIRIAVSSSYVRSAIAGAVIVILAASSLPIHGAVAQDFSKGDFWTYRVTDILADLTLSGRTTVSYNGTGSVTVNGTDFDVYIVDFDTFLEGNSSSSNLSMTITASERAYYTVETLDLAKDDYVSNTTTFDLSTGSFLQYTQTHNITTIFPPGGYGSWPSDLTVGETWAISYPSSSKVDLKWSGGSNEISSFVNETITYRFAGTGNFTVPAGTFNCIVLTESTPDWTQTSWQSPVAGSQVKIVYQSNSGETTTWLLESYSYARGASRTPGPFYAAGAAAAVLGVAVVALLLWPRGRKGASSEEETQHGTGIHPDVPHDPWRPYQ